MSKKRSILVLTQPLSSNYGGVLQAYALQVVLKRLGHSVDTDIHSLRYRKKTYLYDVIAYLYRLILKLSNNLKSPMRFVVDRIAGVEFLNWRHLPDRRLIDRYDTFIVGSDQVWRPRYNDWQPNYFLEFINNRRDVRRIAYAASYGVDESEYSEELQLKCGKLLQQFDAVSVREFGGVRLTKTLFDVDAVAVLDPTLLLDIADYNSVIESSSKEEVKHRSLMVYVLDLSEPKTEITNNVARELDLTINRREIPNDKCNKGVEEYALERWLAGFRDCDFVVTDSFHGTVLSIIYNKPFISIVNSRRGASRFESLLAQFGLQDRVIKEGDDYLDLLNRPIDFGCVNSRRDELKRESVKFLKDALK